jgi:thiamine kinase-like enzyme
VDFLKKELPRYFLPKNLPIRVIHGDPKVSNILFDSKGKAKAVIDLDTCNRRPLLVELGDAFRSWCGNEEDDPKNKFCLHMFQSAWGGYKKGADGLMISKERRLVPRCIGTITLELACRFLTDYFADNYFGWDSNRYQSRRDHNLARARGQIAQFLDYRKKLPKIEKIVI